mgnify:CR=1 FL=1
MSRVAKNPVKLPQGVEIKLDGQALSVKGAKGTLELSLHPTVEVVQEDGELRFAARAGSPNMAMAGTTRALVNNMVIGVSEGFTKELQIVGIGYRATAQGDDALELQLGYSHAIRVKAPEGVTFDVPEPTRIIVSGIDKQAVGQVAADIRSHRKPEPYKGKGIRYLGEYVARKAGKAAK